jgi:hypothetical protein
MYALRVKPMLGGRALARKTILRIPLILIWKIEMYTYLRKYPIFSLCGLNCCLCPRYNTEGSSKCSGCGGENFSLQHPTCAVITCNKKHNNVEYCYECNEYPCEKYKNESSVDSFISYKDVHKNFTEAQNDLQQYIINLNRKYEYLQILLNNYNDGRLKGFYCLCVNLLPLEELGKIMLEIDKLFIGKNIDKKEMGIVLREIFENKAKELGIELKLRK